MNNNENKPLYKVLNELRTQGVVNATTQTYLGFYELRFKDGDVLCTVRKVNDNDRYFANAEYTALAVNNLAPVADALRSMIALFDRDLPDGSIGRVKCNEAKEALKRIS